MIILELNALIEFEKTLKLAFTHSSLDPQNSYERLEFLGDALIGAYITDRLYDIYSKEDEGVLSRYKSAIVSKNTMAEISEEFNLADYLKIKDQELKKNIKIKASLVESYLGAIHKVYGFESFCKEAEALFGKYLLKAEKLFIEQDPKTLLQEKVQEKMGYTPKYKLINKEKSIFKVALIINDKEQEFGEGNSIKQAEKDAASKYLRSLM